MPNNAFGKTASAGAAVYGERSDAIPWSTALCAGKVSSYVLRLNAKLKLKLLAVVAGHHWVYRRWQHGEQLLKTLALLWKNVVLRGVWSFGGGGCVTGKYVLLTTRVAVTIKTVPERPSLGRGSKESRTWQDCEVVCTTQWLNCFAALGELELGKKGGGEVVAPSP